MVGLPRRRKTVTPPTPATDLALRQQPSAPDTVDNAEQLKAALEEELRHPTPISQDVRRTALKAAATRGQTITAAVSRVELDGASWRSYRFGDRAWQMDAWRLYDITGQLRFVANWVGNCLSRCILRVYDVDDQGNIGAPVEDPEIAQLGSGPLGIGDSRAEALRLCGIDLFVPGEAFLIAEAEGGIDGSDLWWVVTARQIKKMGDIITIPRSPLHGGGTFVYRDGVDLILRCWTPHPADTNEPDSSTRSAIPDLRKMEAIRKREFAELDSRLTGAGMLFVPDSMDLPRGPDDPQGPDGFSSLLMRTMAASLRDRSSAEAMVPIVVQGNAADIDKIKHLTFWSPMSEQLSGMWQNTLISLAEDLDVPPEVMTGLGGSNHWCTVRDAEIMTRDGWKTYEHLIIGEDVLTLNHETGLSEWKPLLAVNTWTVANQEMIKIDGKGHHSLTTLNHRWPIIVGERSARRGRSWTTTSEIVADTDMRRPDAQRYDYLVTAAPHATLPTEPKYSDALVELVAWYFTEGDHGQRAGRNTPRTIITQSPTVNPDNCVRIERALTTLIGPPSEFDKGGRYATTETTRRSAEAKRLRVEDPNITASEIGRRLGVSSTMASKYLKTEPKLRDDIPRWRVRQTRCGTINRYLLNAAAGELLHAHAPGRVVRLDFITALTTSQLELFIDTAVRADGWRVGGNTPVLDQKEPVRLDAFELAAILSGRSIYRRPRTTTGRSANGDVQKTSHIVSVNESTTFAPRGNNISREMYTGVIWCPTTANRTWLARHNGTAFYTGNSAWAVSDAAVTEQIKPVASRIASALTVGYLWPALEALGVDDVTRFAYQFDTSLLTVRPNRSADAMTYHTAGLISDDTARTAGAWIDDDAPSPQEQARRFARELALASPQVALADPGVRQLLAFPGIGGVSGGQESTQQPVAPVPVQDEQGPPDTQPQGTDGRPDDQQQPPPPVASVNRSGLDVALTIVARRAMTLAGQRLIPHSQRARHGTVPSYQLSARHGPVPGHQVPTLLMKAWCDLDMVADRYQLDTAALTELLTDFCRELLVRGIAYSDDLVCDLLASPGVITRLGVDHG